MSTSASFSGSAYSRTASVVSGPNGSSLSISGTSRGQGTAVSRTPASSVRTSCSYRPRLDGRLRREEPDPAVPGRLHRRVRLGRDHADDRHRQRLLELGQRGRGRAVARDEDQLHALPLQVAGDLVREARHLRQRPRAVRQPRRVAEVDEVLVRHRHEALVQDGQAAHARVEHPDRPGVHGRRLTAGTLLRCAASACSR